MPPQFQNQQNPLEGVLQGKKITPPAFIWILIVVAMLAGFFEIYKLYISQQNQVQGQNADSSVQIATTSASSDQFADWKTYRNEEYGFEFKYPDYMVLETDLKKAGDGSYFLNLSLYENLKLKSKHIKDLGSIVQVYYLELEIYESDPSQEDYKYLLDYNLPTTLPYGENTSEKNLTSRTFAGEKWVDWYWVGSEGRSPHNEIYTYKDGMIWELTLDPFYEDRADYKQYDTLDYFYEFDFERSKKIYQEILSAFKFIAIR